MAVLYKECYDIFVDKKCIAKEVLKRSNSVKPWEVIGPFGLSTYRRLEAETVPGGVKYVLKNK